MNAVVASLILWINANTAFDYQGGPPQVRLTDPDNLVYLMLGEVWRIPKTAREGLRGLYDAESRTIWLRDDFDPQNKRHQGHLVHELVHFLQYDSPPSGHPCGESLELEAYSVQNKFLRAHRLQPYQATTNTLPARPC